MASSKFTDEQKGVARGMVPAAVVTAASLGGAWLLIPASVLPTQDTGHRLAWAMPWTLLPILTLMVSIMRVANHRFFSPVDIAGSVRAIGCSRLMEVRL